MAALLFPAALAITPSRRLGVVSAAHLGLPPILAGRHRASGLFGQIAVESALGFPDLPVGLLQPSACSTLGEERIDAAQSHSSILIACGNRVMLPSDAAASTCNPSNREV